MSQPEHDRERLALAMEAAGFDLWENNLDTGEITKMSTKVFSELGYSSDEVVPTIDGLMTLIHPDDVRRIEQAIGDHIAGKTARYRCEFRGFAKSGEWVWFDNYGRIVEDEKSGRRFIGLTFNVNERKRHEDELARNRNLLREVEQRQLLLEERNRLVQDMHDGLGSSLVSALRMVESGQISSVQIGQVLRECIDDLKLVIDSMDTVDADLLLLLATFRFRIGPRLEASGIRLYWEVQDVPALRWLTPRSSLHILRIMQESFSNIIKHAKATEVRVATSADADNVIVSVVDNGRGFDVESGQSFGKHGLGNQQRRASAIDGAISWVSSSCGTRVELCLPVEPKAKPAR